MRWVGKSNDKKQYQNSGGGNLRDYGEQLYVKLYWLGIINNCIKYEVLEVLDSLLSILLFSVSKLLQANLISSSSLESASTKININPLKFCLKV